jgi:hypothetical protein
VQRRLSSFKVAASVDALEAVLRVGDSSRDWNCCVVRGGEVTGEVVVVVVVALGEVGSECGEVVRSSYSSTTRHLEP